MDQIQLAVIGGDTRQVYAALALQSFGYHVSLCGFDCFETFPAAVPQITLNEALRSDVTVLPLPFSKNNKTVYAPFAGSPLPVRTITDAFQSGQLVFMGNTDQKTLTTIELHGARVYDYFSDETLILYNARLTAEGLLGIIVEELPSALLNAEIALIGFGRIACYTAALLHSCGAKITVFARAPLQLAKAAAEGYTAKKLPDALRERMRFDCIVNTAPAQILTADPLSHLNTDCLLIEAASAPYGIDLQAASDLGFRVCKAFSLPGRVSPKSAGAAIAETIQQKIRR